MCQCKLYKSYLDNKNVLKLGASELGKIVEIPSVQ